MQLAEHAQAILADDAILGISRADPLLRRLATKKGASRHAGEKAFGGFQAEGMSAPITISRVTISTSENHPILYPTDFLKALDAAGKLALVMPHQDLEKCKVTLSVFWQRWRDLYGRAHTIFQHLSEEHLELTVPCRLHGDEGRSALVEIIIFLGRGFQFQNVISYPGFEC